MNRFDTPAGDNGLHDYPHGLIPFDAHYRFQDRTFSITLWCKDRAEAERHCAWTGLNLIGQIVHVEE